MTRLAMLLFLLSACAGRGHQQVEPVSTVERWIDATNEDDAKAAYALLTKEARDQLDFTSFLKLWNDTKPERKRQTTAMRTAIADRASVEERALIGLPSEGGAHLVREEEGWRLDAPLVSSVHTPEPQDALAHLRKAMGAPLSVDQLLRILSSAARERLEGRIKDFRDGLEDNKGAEVQVSGHVAFLEWKDDKEGRWKIKLILENGEWRVDDVFLPR